MIDRDLASLYGVETKALNQAVKRNSERFPNDFMFQLTKKEFEVWKSQIVTSNKEPFFYTLSNELVHILSQQGLLLSIKKGDDITWLLASGIGYMYSFAAPDKVYQARGFEDVPVISHNGIAKPRSPYESYLLIRSMKPGDFRSWKEAVEFIKKNRGSGTFVKEPEETYFEGSFLANYALSNYGEQAGFYLIFLYGTQYDALNPAQMEIAARMLVELLRNYHPGTSLYRLEERVTETVKNIPIPFDATYSDANKIGKGWYAALIQVLLKEGVIAPKPSSPEQEKSSELKPAVSPSSPEIPGAAQRATERVEPASDRSMTAENEKVGGIDLNSNLLNLQTQGESVDLPPFEFQELPSLPLDGFMPIIQEVHAMSIANLSATLELNQNTRE